MPARLTRSLFRSAVLAALVFLVCLPLAAQTAEPKPISPSPAANSRIAPVSESRVNREETSDLPLTSGDLIDVRVYGEPDLSGSYRVSDNGGITMPLIGDLELSGLTLEEAQKQMAQRFRDGGFMRDPQITLFLKESAAGMISILGEVIKPGRYSLPGSPRLFDALSAAEGVTSRAGREITILHRNELQQVLELSSDTSNEARENIALQPGDTLIVSRAGIVYVSGDVKMPGGYVMDGNQNLTVLQAIALAQGLNPTASLGKARIIRRRNNKLEDIPVPLKQITAASAPDISLENEDVLFIPNSTSKSAARRSLESIVQVATGMAIYRR